MELASAHNCQACPLAKTRLHIVDGLGPLSSPVLFVGEGPGGQEDASGSPFVGQSGKLVRWTVAGLAAKLMLPTNQFRYTNAVRCRPPDNRDPEPGELAACAPWLVEELEAMPNLKAVIALGKYGLIQANLARNVLGLTDLYVTQVWHPAFVLRQPRKRPEWNAQLQYALEEAFRITLPVREVEPWEYGWPSHADPYFAMDTETDTLEDAVNVEVVGYSEASNHYGEFSRCKGCVPDLGGPAFTHVWLHNAKYDLPLLGIDPYDYSKWDDTMLGIYVLRQHDRVGLKEVGPMITGLTWDQKITDLLKERVTICKTLKSGKEKCREAWKEAPFSRAIATRWEEARRYATTDAVQTSRLARYVSEEFERNPWAHDYYLKFEKPLVPVLLGMETRGIEMDLDALALAGAEISTRLKAAEAGLREHIPESISLTAPMQAGPWLLAHGIVDGKLTPTGHVGTAKQNILKAFNAELPEQIPSDTDAGRIATLWLEAGHMRKLDSTYVQALTTRALAAPDRRIHPRFNQAATATDRLSSSDPNAQNIPTRGALGAVLRRAFRARAGYRLVVADYSQLELRIWAEITRDPFFLGAFVGSNTYDPHTRLAEWLMATFRRDSSFADVRKDAKNTNFGAIYGADDAKLATTAKIPRGEARAFIEQLRAQAPSLSSHRLSTRDLLDSQGWVETLLGWRGYYPLYYSPIRSESAAALREAGNLRIQGTASGIVKDLMIAYDTEIAPEFDLPRASGAFGGLLLQAHDELVVEVPSGREEKVAQRLEALGAEVGRRWLKTVPLKFAVDIGPNWGEAKPK